MPTIDCVVETEVSNSARARQVEALFDVPPRERARLEWKGEVPIDDDDWQIGLITGPSGCGKSTLAHDIFGDAYHPEFSWPGKSVIDDAGAECSVQDTAAAFSAVGFNTVPAWLRPHHVLSNGERFRVDLARRLLELPDPVVVDEFSSVVDRQVAKIGSHAVQKWVRRNDRKFVAVSCHEDVIDWLQPDWVFRPADMSFARRLVQQRPAVDCELRRVDYGLWQLFAPYHYMSARLHRAARCFGLFVDGRPVCFAGILHRPHARVHNLKGVSRVVTLPDWQGLGLAFVLIDTIAAAYRGAGYRFRNYPAHPSYIRSIDRSPKWRLEKKPGTYGSRTGATSSRLDIHKSRPCAVFEYVGETMPADEAERFISGADSRS